MWQSTDIQSHSEGVKRMRHPVLGPIAFEYSAFAVDGRPDLSMIVYNPVDPEDRERIRALIAQLDKTSAVKAPASADA